MFLWPHMTFLDAERKEIGQEERRFRTLVSALSQDLKTVTASLPMVVVLFQNVQHRLNCIFIEHCWHRKKDDLSVDRLPPLRWMSACVLATGST